MNIYGAITILVVGIICIAWAASSYNTACKLEAANRRATRLELENTKLKEEINRVKFCNQLMKLISK